MIELHPSITIYQHSFTTTLATSLQGKSIGALSNQYLRTGYTVLLGMHNMVVCATLDLMYVVLVPVDTHLN